MDISLGIFAYNEEKNMGRLLDAILTQNLKDVKIKEIIIVSSGSTDQTDQIVKEYSKRNKMIRLITEKKRTGKANAINLFLKYAKSIILIVSSADILPEQDAIENICRPLKKNDIGIVSCRPIPKTDTSIIGSLVRFQWYMHHQLSKKNPKFGEMIAFRNVINKIGATAVDEEYIAMMIKKKGFKDYFAKDSIVYNKGPENVKDFITQRRRIHCGHLELRKTKNHKVASLSKKPLLISAIKYFGLSKSHIIIFGIIIESTCIMLGYFDYYSNKKHYIWKISKSTK